MIGRDDLRLRLHYAEEALHPPGWVQSDEGLVRHEEPEVVRIPAAVLIGLIGRPEGPHVVLTLRTAHLHDHAAEVSLPGGRIETEDEGPQAAALREALEEIGLDPAKVDVLGHLPPYDTVTGFRIHPLVGWIDPPVLFDPDPFEVADVFEVPLAFLLDPANHQRGSLLVDGRPRMFYVFPYPGRYIWGATAGILVNFARLLTLDVPGNLGTLTD